LKSAALDILHHHESVDGSGYPAGLRNSEIPIVSRIVCVIDAYDAMVSSRPYRKACHFARRLARLIASSGTQFDAAVVNSFLPIAELDMRTVFAAAGTSIDLLSKQFHSGTLPPLCWEARREASLFYRIAAVLLLLFAAGHTLVFASPIHMGT